jgi:hypothetical protein
MEGGETGGSSGGGAAGAADSGTPCKCRNWGDVCSTGLGTPQCVRAGYTCNALSPCDSGYTCSSGVCQCVDPTVCGIDCSSTPCPSGLECDNKTSLCRNPRNCIYDEACPAGERCVEDGSIAGQCRVTGNKAVGAACSRNTDCATGRCETGVCLAPCRATSDCPNGQFCVAKSDEGFVCVATPCTANCSAAQACSVSNTCVQPCDSNAECGSGRKCTSGQDLGLPVCVSGTPACGADDIDGDGLVGIKCLKDGGWEDSDCPGAADAATEYACNRVFGANFCTE